MGLRTASVRHSHVEVMAPALTEATQSQNFNLPTKTSLIPASPINSYEQNKYQAKQKQIYSNNVSPFPLDSAEVNNAFITLALASEKIELSKCLNGASENNSSNNTIMSLSPSPMGDQDNKMGLQKTGLDISSIHKEKLSSDMEQLFNNFSSVLPENDNVCTSADLGPNVEDIMQVIKSMEGSERLNNTPNDLNNENEEIFPMTGSDLTNNLSSFEKELLENVDVMNITIEDQQDELENVDKQKESQAKEILADLQTKHAKVERRLDFLRRRVYKLQSRLMGQHISGEIAGVFENVHRSLKKSKDTYDVLTDYNPVENLKPMSYGSVKTLIKKLEMTSILQANIISKQRHQSKYFGSGSVDLPTFRNTTNGAISIPPWPTETKSELQKVTEQLQTQLGLVQKEVDSEATESSSGGESCDEMQTYNNPHQQYLSVQKRALWKYSTDRAVIAARWTWLQAQIADLEYRIRQHTELHKHVRSNKGGVQLGGCGPPSSPQAGAVNGYRGQLPGATKTTVMDETCPPEFECARTRPLVNFRKRKLLQVSGLHAVSKKAARPSTIRCGCENVVASQCALCTGRTDPTYPRDPPDTLSRVERVALLDPSFHPVFSLPEDISQNIHLEAIMKTSEWQQKSTRMKSLKVLSKPDRMEPKSLEHRTKKLEHRKKYGRLLKPSTISALSAKIKNKIRGRKPGRHSLNRLHRKRHSSKDVLDQAANSLSMDGADEEVESIGNNSFVGPRSLDSGCSSPLLHMQSISGLNKRNRIHSYDIDNIVIPYSVAASTRVEKLQYKEILTPKWRIAVTDYNTVFENKNNGEVKEPDQESDVEDLSDEAVVARHDRCEHEEKKRFLSYLKLPVGYGRVRSQKRTDSRAESSGANTPDPMSPHNMDTQDVTNSPMTSPPATPLSMQVDDSTPLPSIAVMRRRTMSSSKFGLKDRELKDEVRCVTPPYTTEVVPPYDRRTFPIDDDSYGKMLESMPENHQFQTNARSQDSTTECEGVEDGYVNQNSPGTESTESAVGDGEEDPNDPEWIDMERINKERYKR